MTPAIRPLDETTAPFLSGRYAPIHDEIGVDRLAVTGDLPADLSGAYLRNGPNPEYPPLGSYTYPLEGDAMIHGVWLDSGTARYANRFVRTAGLRAEERAGRALFGGLMTPSAPERASLGADVDPSYPFKLNPSIHVVRHAGRILALAEGPPPYEIGPDLDTVGRHDFGGALAGMCAHPKVDLATGQMILFRYTVDEPYLSWAVIGSDGAVIRPPTAIPGVDRGFMVHDFAITARYAVLVVAPLTFDRNALMRGEQPLTWAPELGTRVALVPRDGSPVRWASCETFWAWHYANAYDDGDHVVIDFPSTSFPGLVVPPDGRPVHAGLARATVDPATGTVDIEHVDDRAVEFPRVDDRLVGRRHRYLTVGGRSGRTALARGEHDVLVRYDMADGTSAEQHVDAALGEVVFAPRHGATGELDGYYLAFATDLGARVSRLLVWDAGDFPAPPRAAITIPHPVPHGLHGSWLPA